MAVRRNTIAERAALEKRAADQRSVVRPKKELGKEREGFAKKGLEAQGRFGIRKGIERVSPRIIKKAVKARTSIDTYHSKLERLSVSELNKEYAKVAEKLKELSKKYNKAKKGKKEVFAKQLRVLEETATKIKELTSSRRVADLERSKKISGEQAKVKKEQIQKIGDAISSIGQEFLFITKGKGIESNRLLAELIRKIDLTMKTRNREMSKEQAIELDRLRDSIDARMRGVVEERYDESQKRSLSAWNDLKVEFDKEPPKFMFEKFFELMKDPERNARSLDNMSKFMPTKIRRTMMEIGNSKRSMDEKRQALGQLRMQIEEFMSDTTRRLQLLGRPKMLDVKYVKDLYNELRKQSDEINKYVAKLTPKQSLESERLELVREMRAKNVVLDREQQERYLILVKKLENLVDKFGTKEAERILKSEDTRFRELFEKEGPDSAFKYLESRIRHYLGLQTNLLPAEKRTVSTRGPQLERPDRKLLLGRPERKLLESPEAAEARRSREKQDKKPEEEPKLIAPKEAEKEVEKTGIEFIEDETARSLKDQLRRHEDSSRRRSNWSKEDREAIEQRLTSRISVLRDSLDKSRVLTGKMVRLQRELIELTKLKGKDLEQGLARVEQSLGSLKEFVDAMDKSQAERQVRGITMVSEIVDRFVKNVTATLESEGKLTRDQLEEVAKTNKALAEAIKDGVNRIDEIPGKLQGLNELVDELRSASKERHDEVIKKLDMVREDAETAKIELKEAMSEIFDARLFEINKSVKSLDENTRKVLQNLGLLEGHFLSLEHFDAVVKECMQEIREGADVGVDLLLDKIKEAGDKVIEKIAELDPKFVKKLEEKLDALTEMTVQNREDILTTLSGMHDDLGKRMTDLEKKIDDGKEEILDVLDKISKGTETDAEIKEIVEELRELLEGEAERTEGIEEAFRLIAERLDAIDGKLDANNHAIAEILRNVIREELNERLARMEGNLDDLVRNGATREDTDAIQAQINELRELIIRNGAGGGGQGGWGPGGYGPGGYGPGGPGGWPPINNNNNNNVGGGRGPGEEGFEDGGGRPPREPGEEDRGQPEEKEKDDKDKGKDDGKKEGGSDKKPEDGFGSGFKKFAGAGLGLGIPVALLAILLFVLSKIFGGGQTTTTSTVKAATVPIMPVAGNAASSSSSFLPSGFMTPLIIILILVALFLLFPKNK
ncbi:MAG: hypothetical protein PHH82_00030 [Candidatus ainarchaeum sp.]|nr:hypothetical protein [Candidatus ainarchaeum sp.]